MMIALRMLLAGLALGTGLLGAAVQAQEPPGTWRFSDDTRPVKVVVVGGSVSAYQIGGYSQWLPTTCRNIEVVNKAKAKLGAAELRQRFTAQVLKNRRVDPNAHETWLVFLGGLNSVGSPEATNLEVGKTLKSAKDAGLRTMALTINPWGAESDRRWVGIEGIAYWEHTQKTVDFVLGRLEPLAALGKAGVAAQTGLVDPADPQRFQAGVLPDVAIDLWSSSLRHVQAKVRDADKLAREAKRSPWVKKRLAALPEAEREAARQALVKQASELPRWFMKPELIGFDAIHPNSQGHKEIARAICGKAPASWGCDCASLDGLAWDRRAGKPTKAL